MQGGGKLREVQHVGPTPRLSVVVPVMFEEGSLRQLDVSLHEVLSELGDPFEIIYVNDGSTDRSAEILNQLAAESEAVSVLHFRRNFGKSAALDAGIKHARGQIIITMDADLQPPTAPAYRPPSPFSMSAARCYLDVSVPGHGQMLLIRHLGPIATKALETQLQSSGTQTNAPVERAPGRAGW